MVISKKIIIFQGFRGGPTFSRGGGGSNFSKGGPNANFYRNPFQWGSRPFNPPPIWIHAWDICQFIKDACLITSRDIVLLPLLSKQASSINGYSVSASPLTVILLLLIHYLMLLPFVCLFLFLVLVFFHVLLRSLSNLAITLTRKKELAALSSCSTYV